MATTNNTSSQDILLPEAPLGPWQKGFAVLLVVIPFIIALCFLISYWPDKPPKDAVHTTYNSQTMTLIESATPGKITTIQFSSLVLVLVSLAGFLGNLVYVATSLTAFIGSGKFRRSWIPWYFVKPFTAAGLALFLYLALNSTAATTPVNLNGIIAAAALAGLFTDIATSKLKEIFTAIFKPTDNLPNKLTDPAPKGPTLDLDAIKPPKVTPAAPVEFEVPGKGLDAKNLVVMVNDKKMDPLTVTPTLLKFTFTPEAKDATVTEFKVVVTDAKGKPIGEKDLGI